MISWALVLPDLMKFLMAMHSLMIGIPCLLAALMDVIGLADVSLNALACLMAVLMTVTFLKVCYRAGDWHTMKSSWFGVPFVALAVCLPDSQV